MKTWRERVDEARARGEFTREDQLAWMDLDTCPAGEAVQKYGLSYLTQREPHYVPSLHVIGTIAGKYLYRDSLDITRFEQALDQIEDLALQIKREQQS